MSDLTTYLDAVRARLAKRPFDAEHHHPSCRERDLQLLFKCAQCGYEEDAEQYATDLARLERIARVAQEVVGALQWASGSPDFNEGGQARQGWEKIARPALARYQAAVQEATK